MLSKKQSKIIESLTKEFDKINYAFGAMIKPQESESAKEICEKM